MLALAATYWSDRGTIEDEFPGVRPWDDEDLTRILKITLDEKLRTLLGDEAIQTYLTWGTGFRDIAAEFAAQIEAEQDEHSIEPDKDQ
jgi:hypothetical protein